MTPGELARRLGESDAPVVVDVRSPAEYEAGHVPHAINIPFTEITRRAAEIRSPLDRELVVYCGHGPRAWIAGARLRRLGFQRITYLRGHWRAWKAASVWSTMGPS